MRSIFTRVFAVCLLVMGLGATKVAAQDTLRIMTYNLLRYGAAGIGCNPTSVTTRNPWLSGIVGAVQPDLFGCNEMGPSSGPTSPANNTLVNVLKPLNSNWEATQITFNVFQDVANMMYYRSDKVGLATQTIIPELNSIRDINYYKFYYKGPGLALGDTTFIEIVQVHLHSSDENTRIAQTNAIMDYLDGLGRPGNFIVQGDFNLDGSTATSFQNMVSHSNADCKFNDVLNLTGNWHANASAHSAMTQATQSSRNDCGSGGALDDRFDQILVSNAILNATEDVSYVAGSYWVPGNSYSPNAAVTPAVLGNLRSMSDHFPVSMDLEISRAVAKGEPKTSANALQVLENPVAGSLRLRLDLTGIQGNSLALHLVNLSGQVVQSWSVQNDRQVQRLDLDAHSLAAGAYFLQLDGEMGRIATQKVLVFGE
jgi:hypothetical protein